MRVRIWLPVAGVILLAGGSESVEVAVDRDSVGAGAEVESVGTVADSVAVAPDSTTTAGRFDPHWIGGRSRAALLDETPSTTLAEALANDIEIDIPAPRREGVRQVVGLQGHHPAATPLYLDGIPLHPFGGPSFDLGLLPLGLVRDLRVRSSPGIGHPIGAGAIELSIDGCAPEEARTRLGAIRGRARTLAGEEIDARTSAGRFGSGGIYYRRRDSDQFVASVPTNGFFDLVVSPSERARALLWKPAVEGIDLRVLHLSLTGDDRPAAFPEAGERTLHIQSDDFSLIGASAAFPEQGVSLTFSSQQSRSELESVFGFGSLGAMEERHTGFAAQWSAQAGERHQLRFAYRLDDAGGAASFADTSGNSSARDLRSDWWIAGDRIRVGEGAVELYAGRVTSRLTDDRFAALEDAPSLTRTAEIGGIEWRSPFAEIWSASIGASAHHRPLTYFEHLYLADELATGEEGLSVRGEIRARGDGWFAEIGGGLTRWTGRVRLTEGDGGANDWELRLSEERQGTAHLSAGTDLIRGLRGRGAWRVDGGDLPSDGLWQHHTRAGLVWRWASGRRPLTLGAEASLVADHDGERWHTGISAAGRLGVTDDFELRFVGRNLAFGGAVYGPQYSLVLGWVLWG